MKIKTKKEFNLPEMIQHIMDNEELRRQNYSTKHMSGRVKIMKSGEVLVEDVWSNDTFIVEVEEELTEETILKGFKLIGLLRREESANYELARWIYPSSERVSISFIKELYDLKTLHKMNDDGSLTLLYTEENGIPDDGVLEYGM